MTLRHEDGRAPGPSVVIVGTGVSGITAAETLRANGFDGRVVVYGDEPHLPYRRTALSKGVLGGDFTDPRITLRPGDYWADRDIEIVCGARVRAVDVVARTVEVGGPGSDASRTVSYEALILATGGRARRLPGAPPLLSLRTREDITRLRAALAADRPATIIGGGLIGLEMAASLTEAGHDVTVLEAAPTVLARVLPESVAEGVAALHRDRGVDIRTGVGVAYADPETVTLADGTVLAGTVISAIGMEPDIALARDAGVPVCAAGIVVDDALRTGVPGVYAAGDVAARPHPLTGAPMRAEQWLTATEHGKLVGMTVAADLGASSTPAAIPRVPLSWTTQYSTNVQMVGWPTAGDRLDVELDESSTTVRSFDGDRLVGAVCTGRGGGARQLRSEIEQTLAPVDTLR